MAFLWLCCPTGNALSCGHSHLASVFAPLGSYYTVAEMNASMTCQDLRQLCLGEWGGRPSYTSTPRSRITHSTRHLPPGTLPPSGPPYHTLHPASSIQ